MAATPTLLSLEEYLRTSYKPDCDYVDGEIEERHLGEYPHSEIQGEVVFQLRLRSADWHIKALPEQRIRVAATHVRICDVCVLRADAPREAVTLTPPLACIEILSPEDRIPRATIVLEDYRLMGVASIWLIDPMRRVAYTYDEAGLHLALSDRLEVPGTPIHLLLEDLFKGLD